MTTKQDDNDWSDVERARLRGLAVDEYVQPEVAERTLRTLKARGLVHRPAPHRFTTWLSVAAVLAAFVVGTAYGELRGEARARQLAARATTVAANADDMELARVVQRTGSAYVSALAALARSDSTARLTSHEVAINLTEAALRELTPIVADTARERLQRSIEQQRVHSSSQLVWY